MEWSKNGGELRLNEWLRERQQTKLRQLVAIKREFIALINPIAEVSRQTVNSAIVEDWLISNEFIPA